MTDKAQVETSLGPFQGSVDEALRKMQEERIMARIWGRDHTVWKEDPAEIANRLGWLDSPEKMVHALPEVAAFVDEVRSEGYTHALLLGMGGSSLAPEVYRLTFGVKEGYLDLSVLDSTHPGAILSRARRLDPARTLFIVSTKSGGTVETLSFMKYFYTRVVHALSVEAGRRHFVAITDPASGLEKAAKALGFRKIFLNDPDIGGRYSALSYFGLVPAALIGLDLGILLDRARKTAGLSRDEKSATPGEPDPAWLGAAMGTLALAGRDKLTLVLSPALAAFGPWVEQLIAESTGKEGKGILPVDGETLGAPDIYARDRLFVYVTLRGEILYDREMQAIAGRGHPVVRLELDDPYDLGSQFFLWEMATAVAGRLLGINPFDQPNVESSKALSRKMVSLFEREGQLAEPVPALQAEGIRVYGDEGPGGLKEALGRFMAKACPGEDGAKGRSYVAIQAYLEPKEETTSALRALRAKMHATYRMATTVGYGPRFLHSTGQLHKGDAGHGLFIQITGDHREDPPVPDEAGKDASKITFGVLIRAQALGDRQALLDSGRKVIRFHLEGDPVEGIGRLVDAVA